MLDTKLEISTNEALCQLHSGYGKKKNVDVNMLIFQSVACI